MTTDLVRSYLKEIGRYPLLSKEEEVSYAKQVQSMIKLEQQARDLALRLGRKATSSELALWLNKTEKELRLIGFKGQKAKNCMLTANLRLVVSVAKKYKNPNMELLDLIQEGSLGLHKSVEKFDPTKGYRFSTYAYRWIQQAVGRAIVQKSRTICLPVNLSEKINKIKRTQKVLFHSLGRRPTSAEIGEVLNLSEQKIVECLKYSRHPVSLNLCLGEGEDIELVEILQADEAPLTEQIDQKLLRDNLENILSSLPDVQRQVLSLRYGIDSNKELTLDQVGEQLNICRERVRQIQNEAIRRLRLRYGDMNYSF
ncbi:MAG: sigma-70 family RNA polymerase sigma factor [Nostoc sp.]|uniref:sigma-70 family RNA polymerase sigma factor n=1 Tax=Nostoc sp. TaxID=1180 RepID=UPI002FFA2968